MKYAYLLVIFIPMLIVEGVKGAFIGMGKAIDDWISTWGRVPQLKWHQKNRQNIR